MTMAEFLTSIGSVFTQCLTWVGDVITFIVGNPALTVLCIAIPVISFGVGLTNRLLRG